MTDDDLDKIGAILHHGGWQFLSSLRYMTEEFLRELETAGWRISQLPSDKD